MTALVVLEKAIQTEPDAFREDHKEHPPMEALEIGKEESKVPSRAPAALRGLSGWLLWRYEQKPGESKARKVPYYASGGRRIGKQGSPVDRKQLVDFDTARAAAVRRGFDGVGLAMLADFGLVALDFDHCVVNGDVTSEVERLTAGTYAEYSPSGTGVRAFLRGDLGNHKDNRTGAYGFEVFSSSGFVTFTGRPLFITEMLDAVDTVSDVSEPVRHFAASRFDIACHRDNEHGHDGPQISNEAKLGLSEAQVAAALGVLDPDMAHDQWLHVGMALHHETDGQGFEHWNEWSSKGGKYPGEDVLRHRWDSFGIGAGRPVTARYLIKLANQNGAQIVLDPASLDEFEVVAEGNRGKDVARFAVVPADQFAAGSPPSWIIKGVIPKAELVVLFGESGSGKSFLALDMGASIARGVDWLGRRTRKGRVVYIAAEGGGGFRNRLKAYEQHHRVSLAGLPLGIVHAAPNFLQKSDVLEVAKAITGAGGADVIVVDTFAQVTPGANENAAEDMGKALAHCRGLHRATGAVVVLVHHAGKDPTRGARGWSGLRAAADAEIEVLRLGAGRVLRISKQKDGEDGAEWGFDLLHVPVGMDDDGDVVESCVIAPAEMPLTGRTGNMSRRPLGKWEKLVQEVVGEFSVDQLAGIEVEQLISEVVRRSPAVEDGKRDTRKQHARRALLALCEGDSAPYFLEDGCISVLE